MKNQRGNAFLGLIIAVVAIVGIYGWVANIIKLIAILDGGLTAMFVARIVGVFAPPLGVVLGFC
jgi:hypothetical protein